MGTGIAEPAGNGPGGQHDDAYYRAIVEDQLELICRFTPDCRLTFVNGAYCRYFARSRESLIGLCFLELIPRDRWDDMHRRFAVLTAANPVMTVEHPVLRPDGSIGWQQWTNRAFFDESGAQRELQAVGRDITDRVRAETALAEKVAELQAVFDAIPDLFVRIGPEGAIRAYYANQKADLYAPPEQFLGRLIRDVLPAPAALRLHEAVSQVYRSGEPHAVEFALPMPRGEQTYEARFWPFAGHDVIAMVRNISEEKQTRKTLQEHAEAIRRQRVELAHLWRTCLVGEMAASLTHELTQPLAAIANYAQGALRRLQNGRAGQDDLSYALNEIVPLSLRAGDSMRRVRDFIRRIEPDPKSISINDVVRRAASFVEPDARLLGTPIDLELCDDPVHVLADAVQIEQVVVNLVRNGMEAMALTDNASRRLRVRTQPDGPDGLRVSVMDRGNGMNAEALSRVFEPFYTTKPDHMGLGLSVCRAIIEAHSGRIWAESAPGGETALHFRLPQERAAPTTDRQ